MVKNYLNYNFDAIVILVYGIGGYSYDILEVFSNWAKKNGKIIVAKSQVLFGKTDLSHYEVGKIASSLGIISSNTLTLEATIAKLSLKQWVKRCK